MARYTGAVCRICRREGMKLYLKGERCYTPKCAVERRGYPPGMHGQSRRKLSDYGLQLREKQKMRRIYGVLERPFRRYFQIAERSRGVTGATTSSTGWAWPPRVVRLARWSAIVTWPSTDGG
jgi:small subunit ribosomal protein S4